MHYAPPAAVPEPTPPRAGRAAAESRVSRRGTRTRAGDISMLFGGVHGHMPKCNYCEKRFETEELVRHEYDGRLLVVHCPACNTVMGTYRTQAPETDTLRSRRTSEASAETH